MFFLFFNVFLFFNFFLFLMFLCYIMSCFLFLLKHKGKNYKFDLFLMGKLRSAVFDLYIQYISVFSLYIW